VRPGDWRRYLAPAAFLLAVTMAVVLIRAGLESGGSGSDATARTVARTTTASTRRVWVVRAGDTFATISKATGVSVRRLQKLNPRVRSTALFIGQRIRLR
jgi:LysM repeat protein